MPFKIAFAIDAEAELVALRAFDRTRIGDAIDNNLIYEPMHESRARKQLGTPKAGFDYEPPLRELKVGEFRVFYNVDEAQRIVRVHAIRRKGPTSTTEEILG